MLNYIVALILAVSTWCVLMLWTCRAVLILAS
jgi:hypothetical protein